MKEKKKLLGLAAASPEVRKRVAAAGGRKSRGGGRPKTVVEPHASPPKQ